MICIYFLLIQPDGDEYDMEVDLLETDCHVLDPLPLANCTVRPKVQTVRRRSSQASTPVIQSILVLINLL